MHICMASCWSTRRDDCMMQHCVLYDCSCRQVLHHTVQRSRWRHRISSSSSSRLRRVTTTWALITRTKSSRSYRRRRRRRDFITIHTHNTAELSWEHHSFRWLLYSIQHERSCMRTKYQNVALSIGLRADARQLVLHAIWCDCIMWINR